MVVYNITLFYYFYAPNMIFIKTLGEAENHLKGTFTAPPEVDFTNILLTSFKNKLLAMKPIYKQIC